MQDQNEKDTVSALREHNSTVRRTDLQFINMCRDQSTKKLTIVILLEVGLVDRGRTRLI